jgi:hypothetical protein
MVTIKIETNNAAFQDGYFEEEVARIIKEAAERVCHGDGCHALRDINGNKVGYIERIED